MTQVGFIDETEVPLEFGDERRHIDIRYGIMNHGVLDRSERDEARLIRVGLIGSPQSNEACLKWIDQCAEGVDSASNRANLHPRFPGFGDDSPFNAQISCDSRSQRTLNTNDLARLASATEPGRIVKEAVALYLNEVSYLVNEVRPDVVICLVTDEVSDHLDRAAALNTRRGGVEDEDDGEATDRLRHDFHHCLKAAVMRFHTPIQLILPSTFGLGGRSKSTKRKRPSRKKRPRQLQDEATRAWNLFTALYYKARGVPWRLPRESSDYDTCYIGIGFYKSLDESRVMTSVAQVFNQRGEGVVVRGGQARVSKDDRVPHLPETAATQIMVDALKRYREEHRNHPARVVLHKTSEFDPPEIAGVKAAMQQERVEMCDMLSIRRSSIRLFRQGDYPVLRGVHVPLGGSRHLLYTRGSVPFFETYTGLYAPRAMELRFDSVEQGPELLCREVLGLTKMNWNNTQFDMRDPITTRAARRVGDIMKYVPDNAPADEIARHYSFYM